MIRPRPLAPQSGATPDYRHPSKPFIMPKRAALGQRSLADTGA
jgi:hypothetical protein